MSAKRVPPLVAVLKANFDITRNGFTFLLGKGSHNGNQNFTLGVHSVDIFLVRQSPLL